MSGFASLSDLVQYFENRSGNPTALNYAYDSTHTASGLYQVTNTTWGGFGGYPTAASAPVEVQQQQFASMVQARGLRDYTCPGCDAALTNYVTNNPSALNLPIFAGGQDAAGAASNPPGPAGFWDWFNKGPTAGQGIQATSDAAMHPVTTATQAATGAVSNVFQPVIDWLGSISTRLGLFVLAIIFIIGALVLFGIKSGVEIQQGGPS